MRHVQNYALDMTIALLIAILLSANPVNHALARVAEQSHQRFGRQRHVLAMLRRPRDSKVLLLKDDVSIVDV